MSVVTDIILVTGIDDGAEREDEHPNADRLSAYLEREHGGRGLAKVDQHAGGRKAMQCDVFMAAVNFLDKDAFLAWFHAIEWHDPEQVQLMLKGEQEERLTIITPEI
jgi:hypothetical protein